MFTAMAVITEVNITNSAGLVKLLKATEKIWIMGSEMGCIEGHVEIMFFDKPGHLFCLSQKIRVEADPIIDIGHIFNGNNSTIVLCQTLEVFHLKMVNGRWVRGTILSFSNPHLCDINKVSGIMNLLKE